MKPDPRLQYLAPFCQAATSRINARVEDARAHAERSVTKAVQNAQAGRETWRAIIRQRSSEAAARRLQELLAWLAGTTSGGLSGHVQDCRADFYRNAFGFWKPQIPDSIRSPDAAPTKSGERAARGLILFGLSPREEMKPVFDQAERSLQIVLNATANAIDKDEHLDAAMETWEQKTSEAIRLRTIGLLSDSLEAIRTMVGREMIHHEIRAPLGGNS